MKVIFINVLYKSGSTGRLCYNISNYLKQLKIDTVTACRYDNDNKSNEVYEISTWLDCHIHNRLAKYTGLQGYFSVFRTLKFINYLKKNDFDIIHLNNIYNSYLNTKILFKYLIKNNIKVVYTLHDCQAYTGGCTHYYSINCDKWKIKCHDCPLRYNSLDFTKKVFNDKKNIYMKFDHKNIRIITVSKWLEKECKSSVLNRFDITTIYNGIDTSNFYKEEINSDLFVGKYVILGVANNWNDSKGLSRFVELSKKIKDDEIIVLIGLTKNQINIMPNNIIGVNKTNSLDELRTYYNRADVFVNLSFEETFGLVVGEALACGTPAIVFNTTACPELVNDKTGIILKKYDSDSIYNAIIQIRKKGKKYYSNSAINSISENFNIKRMEELYMNIYNDLIK